MEPDGAISSPALRNTYVYEMHVCVCMYICMYNISPMCTILSVVRNSLWTSPCLAHRDFFDPQHSWLVQASPSLLLRPSRYGPQSHPSVDWKDSSERLNAVHTGGLERGPQYPCLRSMVAGL